jgi:uncharacterized membrane protein
MTMDLYVIVLRILHIFGAVFWAGTTFLFTGYVGPAVMASGPEGNKFMQALLGQTRFLRVIAAAAGLTALSGLLLYWRASGGLRPAWIGTGTGLGFTIGGTAGLAAAFIGILVQNRAGHRLVALGREVQAGGGAPTPEQGAQMQAAGRAISQGGRWSSILLILAVLGMATAQYLSF